VLKEHGRLRLSVRVRPSSSWEMVDRRARRILIKRASKESVRKRNGRACQTADVQIIYLM
jgi:hypothetical protein